jgi:hypothetical protein
MGRCCSKAAPLVFIRSAPKQCSTERTATWLEKGNGCPHFSARHLHADCGQRSPSSNSPCSVQHTTAAAKPMPFLPHSLCTAAVTPQPTQQCTACGMQHKKLPAHCYFLFTVTHQSSAKRASLLPVWAAASSTPLARASASTCATKHMREFKFQSLV